jgi:L-rhamnonate dehydratase
MKITDVQGLHLRWPGTRAPAGDPREALLVRVATDAGIAGWGEVDACPQAVQAIIEAPASPDLVSGLRHLLVGQDPLDTDHLWGRMYEGTLHHGRAGVVIQAMAGVDLALWDLKGKALDQPVCRLLGDEPQSSLRVSVSGTFGDTPEATAKRVRAARDAGYTAMKLGPERLGEDPSRDSVHLEAVRREIGPEMELMLDAAHGWDARTTLERARRLEPCELLWIEEPLHPDDLDGYAVVSAECETPIAAGREECTVAGFDRLLEIGGVDVVQVASSRVGLTQAMTVAMLAQARGVPVVNHGSGPGVGLAACLHLLSSVPNAFVLEYEFAAGERGREILRDPLRVVEGQVRVPEEPGLGVEPDPVAIERYLVRG